MPSPEVPSQDIWLSALLLVCPDVGWEEKTSFTIKLSPLGRFECLQLLVVAYNYKSGYCRCIAWHGFLILLMGGFNGEIANILLHCRWRVITRRMRRAWSDCICKLKACESVYHSIGLLMVLVRTFHLWGEGGLGTKQDTESCFVWGIFPPPSYSWGGSTDETSNILAYWILVIV